MIDFSAFSDELVKIAEKGRDLSTGEKAAVIGGAAVGSGAAAPTGMRIGEAIRHSRKINRAVKAGEKSVTLRYLRAPGYVAPAVGAALVSGGVMAAAVQYRKKRLQKNAAQDAGVDHARFAGGITGVSSGAGLGYTLARRGGMGQTGKLLSSAVGAALGYTGGRAVGGAVAKGKHHELARAAAKEYVEANENDPMVRGFPKTSEDKNRRMNKEKIKQFLGNTALVAGGTGIGYGASEVVRHGLKKFRGSPGSKVRQIASIALPMVGGASVIGYKRQLDKEKKRSLEDAYQRGVTKGQRDV